MCSQTLFGYGTWSNMGSVSSSGLACEKHPNTVDVAVSDESGEAVDRVSR